MRKILAVLALAALSAVPATAQEREVIGTPSSILSPAIKVGNMVYASGQLGLRRNAEDQSIEAQTRAALENTKRVLEMAGTDLAHVVRCVVYLVEAADYRGMNSVYTEFFPTNPPARSTVVLKALVIPGALVEIECTAVMPTR